MRPVSVFANGLSSEIEQLRGDLHGRWWPATWAVMVLLSLYGLPAGEIAELPDYHPATVRCWISRFNDEGPAGRPPADQADRRAAGPPQAVNPARARRYRAGHRPARAHCIGGPDWSRSCGGPS